MVEQRQANGIPVELVEDAGRLAELVALHGGEDRYAIDTEFVTGKAYGTQLALIQVGWREQIILVDPLATDISPLAELIAGPSTALLHAAASDLEILEAELGHRPKRMFDTQLAAQLLGWPTPSLKVLVGSLLGVGLDKTKQYSDWAARPLSDASIDYAASDVAYLHQLQAQLEGQLAQRGREAWATEEFDAALTRRMTAATPEQLWWRISRAGSLSPSRQLVVQRLAIYREERAKARNRPPSQVLRDEAIVAIASKPPTTVRMLKAMKGLATVPDPMASEIVALVGEALEADRDELVASPDLPLESELDPLLNVLAAFARQKAMDLEVDADLLASRRDLTAYLSGSPNRLAEGWRREVLLGEVEALRAGDARITLEGDRVRLAP